jgi:hypothetical protein
MKTTVATLSLLLVACSAQTVTQDEAPHLDSCPSGDVSECAIEHFELHVGKLSESCQEVVRATTVNLVTHKAVNDACNAPYDVLGCMTDYSVDGATVWVRNDGDRLNTQVHELTHVALRCARGNADAAHSAYGNVWQDLQAED